MEPFAALKQRGVPRWDSKRFLSEEDIILAHVAPEEGAAACQSVVNVRIRRRCDST